MKMITMLVLLISLATIIPPVASPPTEPADSNGLIDREENLNQLDEDMNQLGQNEDVSSFDNHIWF
mgnify:CR=1 FL=1